MNTYIIEIKPKKAEFDPLAKQVQNTLIENGEPETTMVRTERLFKIEGTFSADQVKTAAATLLVDPVVESSHVIDSQSSAKKKKASKEGYVLDVWPKQGVTDPVGETVEKGLRDLGFQGDLKASSAYRYIFSKIKSADLVRSYAQQFLANELIHDIHIRKND